MWTRLTKRKPANRNSYSDLNKCIQNYRQRREKLISLTIQTINLFDKVSHLLSADIVKCFDSNSLMSVIEELGASSISDQLKMENMNIENPIIAVLGELKSGKSSFINCLFEKNVVPTPFDRCTDKITRLSFSEKNNLEIIDEDGKVVKKKYLKKTSLPRKYVSCDDGGKKKDNTTLRVNLKVKFLESGIDLIDSPGLNENDCLINISKLIQNTLPIIIYVIDGRSGVKQTDAANLHELKHLVPNLEIIYFVTHLDPEDNEEDVNQDPINCARSKMYKSFLKLQFHNFIPKSYKHWNECPYFHGASLTCFIKHKTQIINQETEYHFNLFCKFYTELNNIISLYFKNKICESCDIVMNFIMDISAKVINYTQNFDTKTKENYEQITLIKKIEAEMYQNIKSAITDSKQELRSRLIIHLEKEADSIIDPIIDTIYPSSIIIPENGIVSDSQVIDQCQLTIIKILVHGLENVLRSFVEEELFKNYRLAIEGKTFQSLKEFNHTFNNKKVGKSPYQLNLERILNVKYKIEKLPSLSPEHSHGIFKDFMNVVLTSIKTFLSNGLNIELKENEINVKSREWKLKQAEDYLKQCDNHLLAEDVCETLFDDFEVKHNAFLNAMKNETILIKKKIIDSEIMKFEITEQTPIFFYLFLQILSIKGQYMFSDIEVGSIIGTGAQSKVYECKLHEKDIAMKSIDLGIYTLKHLTEEIFYSNQISHENLLPTLGVKISDDEKRIDIFYPLMKMNLREYMKFHVMNQKTIIKISLEIVEGIQYLHNQDIIHKDIKLPNILMDENECVCISDYGCCKSEIITRHFQDKIPINIAPEVIEKQFYSKKMDVYSFGILLWNLFVGLDKIPTKATFSNSSKLIVWNKQSTKSECQMKTENSKRIPDKIWPILENCWNYNYHERPDFMSLTTTLMEFS